jgi:hypothetical protein
MYAVEFKARVRDGSIVVPRKYRHLLTDAVKVIVMKEDVPEQTVLPAEMTAIDRLLAEPLRIAEFRPFTRDEVYER